MRKVRTIQDYFSATNFRRKSLKSPAGSGNALAPGVRDGYAVRIPLADYGIENFYLTVLFRVSANGDRSALGGESMVVNTNHHQSFTWNFVARGFRPHEQLQSKLREKISKLGRHLPVNRAASASAMNKEAFCSVPPRVSPHPRSDCFPT
jgi:hypothetical protein